MTTQPLGFISLCAVLFCVALAATIYFCRSMCCEKEMPGGWAMSMMWMRMPGQTWPSAATSFLLMWLAMMVAMMMPSAAPAFLDVRRSFANSEKAGAELSAALAAVGYFAVWLAVGAGIYLFGVTFAAAAMRWELFSRAVPALSAVALLVSGAIQFSPWKMSRLLRCRSPLGCTASACEPRTGWNRGLKQGVTCVICCVPQLVAQMALGVMNPWAMVVIALTITAEKLLPWPKKIVSLAGIAAIGTGAIALVRVL